MNYLITSRDPKEKKHQIQILITKNVTRKISKKKGKVGDHRRGGPEGSFSIATTPFPLLLHFTLDHYLTTLNVKQGSIKYYFLSLWYKPRSPRPLVTTLLLGQCLGKFSKPLHLAHCVRLNKTITNLLFILGIVLQLPEFTFE